MTEPIKSGIRDRRLGLGKQEEDDYFTAEENIHRRKLDIEIEETEEIAKKREVCSQNIFGNDAFNFLKTRYPKNRKKCVVYMRVKGNVKKKHQSFITWLVAFYCPLRAHYDNPGPSRT